MCHPAICELPFGICMRDLHKRLARALSPIETLVKLD